MNGLSVYFCSFCSTAWRFMNFDQSGRGLLKEGEMGERATARRREGDEKGRGGIFPIYTNNHKLILVQKVLVFKNTMKLF